MFCSKLVNIIKISELKANKITIQIVLLSICLRFIALLLILAWMN
jgi:hypothetical protein